MLRGIYAAASAMVYNFRRQMIVSNNVANVSTTGYKQDVASFADSPGLLIVNRPGSRGDPNDPSNSVGKLGTGSELGEVVLDMSQGDLVETGNPLDLAISGEGFFAVQTDSGKLFTRDGTFFRDASGRLARADGGILLGEEGPIQLAEGEVLVDGDGTVRVDGQVAGRIRLVSFSPEERLQKIGNNYVSPDNINAQEQPVEGAAISQGFLERSNVDLTRASVEMLAALRSYEAAQKMIILQDQALDRAINEVGRV